MLDQVDFVCEPTAETADEAVCSKASAFAFWVGLALAAFGLGLVAPIVLGISSLAGTTLADMLTQSFVGVVLALIGVTLMLPDISDRPAHTTTD